MWGKVHSNESKNINEVIFRKKHNFAKLLREELRARCSESCLETQHPEGGGEECCQFVNGLDYIGSLSQADIT